MPLGHAAVTDMRLVNEIPSDRCRRVQAGHRDHTIHSYLRPYTHPSIHPSTAEPHLLFDRRRCVQSGSGSHRRDRRVMICWRRPYP